MKYFFIFALLFSFACGGGDSSDTTTNQTIDNNIYSVSGKFHKGKCLKDGLVSVQPLTNGSFDQSGNHFTGYTDQFGYNIPVKIDQEYSEVFGDVWCDDEVNGGNENYRLSAIVKNSDPDKNINPLTRIRSIVARSVFSDGFGTVEACLIESERLILSFLNMPTTGRFTEMSLEKSTLQDSVSLLVSSAILYGRSGPQQGDYMVTLAEAIINNDQTVRTDILTVYNQLPIITIKENLESSLGNSPPFWNIIAPDLNDLLENAHNLQGSFNLYDSMGRSFDANGYNEFAIPHIFESWIDLSNYFSTNLDGDISIWTHTFDGYDRPGTKIFDMERLSRNILDDPIKLQYNGVILEHENIAGQKVYIRIFRETAFRLSTGENGGFLPFGRKLASKDGGLNWIGHDNNTAWFRLSGVMMYGVN